MKIRILTPALVVSVLSPFTGCGFELGDEATDGSPGAVATSSDSGRASSADLYNPAMVNVKDPVEGAFTIDMPKGWRNLAYTARAYDQVTTVVNSVSPNGEVIVFAGDPSSPLYFKPNSPTVEVARFQEKVNPKIKVQDYVPAQTYFADYARRKFGKLDGFEYIKVEPEQDVLLIGKEMMREAGFNFPMESARVHFRYKEDGQVRNAFIVGLTSDMGFGWIVMVGGISSSGDPLKALPIYLKMTRSLKSDEGWKRKQQELHEQRMAEIQRAHQQQLGRWAEMNARHQERMAAIKAFGDASMKSYYERDAASDRSHRNFINMINEESTVATSDGRRHQVSNVYQNYYIHKRTGQYIGGDIHFNEDSIRRMGLNPDDYEQAKVTR